MKMETDKVGADNPESCRGCVYYGYDVDNIICHKKGLTEPCLCGDWEE